MLTLLTQGSTLGQHSAFFSGPLRNVEQDEVKGAGIRSLEISISTWMCPSLSKSLHVLYHTALRDSRVQVLERLLVYLLQFNNKEVGERVIKTP